MGSLSLNIKKIVIQLTHKALNLRQPKATMVTAMLNCRTLFLSDIHLGCKNCQAGFLLNFLKNCQVDTIYLLGDIVDLWAMQKQVFWQIQQNQVVLQRWRLDR